MKNRWLFLFLSLALGSSSLFAGPLKVYILAGQSNMQGTAAARTLPYMAHDPISQPLLAKILDKEGKPRVYSDIHVAAFSEKKTTPTTKNGPLTLGFGKQLVWEDVFGPELGFGITMHEHVKEPILIIKTAWGGKSLHTDFRPPSAAPKEGAEKGGHYYKLMMKNIKEILSDPSKVCAAYDPKEGYELAGFVWFQGFNDMIDSTTYPNIGKEGRYKEYSNLLSHLIRDVRKEFSTPKMPFVIGVMGVGGAIEDFKYEEKGIDAIEFRKAMAAPAQSPEFKGNVFAVRTGKFWDAEIAAYEKVEYKHRRKLKEEFKKKKNIVWGDLDRPGRHKYWAEEGEYVKKRLIEICAKELPGKDAAKLMEGKSNAGYHYLGCGKTIALIGEAFAKALQSGKQTD